MRRLDLAFKFLKITSLVMFAFSIFLPWVSESGTSFLAIYPPIVVTTKYWSYQSVTNTNGHVFVSTFQKYWQLTSDFGFYQASSVWFIMFVLQILTVGLGFLSVVIENVKRHSIPFFGAISTLGATLILGFHQFYWISNEQDLNYHHVSIETGLWLALFSFILVLTEASLILIINVHDRLKSARKV
jgi:hypothetical protein